MIPEKSYRKRKGKITKNNLLEGEKTTCLRNCLYCLKLKPDSRFQNSIILKKCVRLVITYLQIQTASFQQFQIMYSLKNTGMQITYDHIQPIFTNKLLFKPQENRQKIVTIFFRRGFMSNACNCRPIISISVMGSAARMKKKEQNSKMGP